MTNTNNATYDGGNGIRMRNAKVELFDVALKGCRGSALDSPYSGTIVATRCEFANSAYGAYVGGSLTSATFKNCVFNGNQFEGISGWNESTVHLHGEATAIHSNRGHGISVHGDSKVFIHLPSHHNTIYNNKELDRATRTGATITNVED